ncbi:TonB-dependent receptor [Sphingomonas baiyangensis]|uniref:TonB-dependent receptor n=1 Tax=Sphingomonas baiyangensis TaxID=2572576 RepID=A0A4U1L053_9SPHN|nr:TonB-dependent receptor [Sphingomonas baiyangensis]TKD49944.1 TonB-dependent receptor [Sphingomonas baiyangensis]
MPNRLPAAIFATTAIAALAFPLAAAAQEQTPRPEAPPPAATAATDQPGGSADAQPQSGEILVTARRRAENVQDVPIAISVLGGEALDDTGAYNVQRLTQLQPTLQFYSQNPRNTSINIRGIGAPLGLTNDGIEQGVGIYIDQVYYNRVAASTLDFVDIEQIEVLRGPQGTLYGKNTTAGAIAITTRAPSFTFEGRAEVSLGNYEFKQAKASVSGPLADDVAVRLSTTTTDRRGTIFNVATNQWIQEQDSLGVRGTVLWRATDSLDLTFSGDFNLQNPICCAQIYARVHPTQRPLNRQYAALAAAFGYAPPSTDPFDRLTDVDAPLAARNEHGGLSLPAEWDLGAGTLTSVTAWRYWDWGPANDRDFTGLPITTRSQNPSHQDQYTQEFRYAYAGTGFDFVVGAFGFYQKLRTTGLEQQGPAASRWTLNPGNVPAGSSGCATPATLACNPAVLDGLTANNDILLENTSLAAFGKLNWQITDALTISPGIRLNYDRKTGFYSSVVTGTASDGTRQLVLFSGPYANDPWIVAQRGVRAPQFYEPVFDAVNLSYDLNLSYRVTPDVLAYATYARAFKSGGINLNGVPTDAAGVPILSAGSIRPEKVDHFELGAKSQFWDRRVTLNVTGFWTEIRDYQANVNNSQLGLLRGYLANADKVRVRGVEADFVIRASDRFNAYASGAYTDHEYVRFVDAPCPPELSGGTSSPPNCDISGQWLPGISNWAASWGAEANLPARLLGGEGEVYLGYDASYRSRFSSNASRSAFLDVEGYSLHNFRAGYRTDQGFNIFAWVRNAFDQKYFEQLATTPGSTGLVAGQPGDPRTWGGTIRFDF